MKMKFFESVAGHQHHYRPGSVYEIKDVPTILRFVERGIAEPEGEDAQKQFDKLKADAEAAAKKSAKA